MYTICYLLQQYVGISLHSILRYRTVCSSMQQQIAVYSSIQHYIVVYSSVQQCIDMLQQVGVYSSIQHYMAHKALSNNIQHHDSMYTSCTYYMHYMHYVHHILYYITHTMNTTWCSCNISIERQHTQLLQYMSENALRVAPAIFA